jgi:hypothetical protein
LVVVVVDDSGARPDSGESLAGLGTYSWVVAGFPAALPCRSGAEVEAVVGAAAPCRGAVDAVVGAAVVAGASVVGAAVVVGSVRVVVVVPAERPAAPVVVVVPSVVVVARVVVVVVASVVVVVASVVVVVADWSSWARRGAWSAGAGV